MASEGGKFGFSGVGKRRGFRIGSFGFLEVMWFLGSGQHGNYIFLDGGRTPMAGVIASNDFHSFMGGSFHEG